MNRRQQQVIHLLFRFLLLGGLFGVAIVSSISKSLQPKALVSGAIMGLAISFLSIGLNLFLEQYQRKFTFRFFVLIKTCLISFIGVGVVFYGTYFFPDIPVDVTRPFMLTTAISFSFVISFLYSLLLGLHRMLGKESLMSILTGRYHYPVEEERIFMFLDMVSSTTVAEKIGHIQFHRFLNEVFFDITPDILDAQGDIYKYVGDEVIISWPVEKGLKYNRCINLYFKVQQTLWNNMIGYEERYGVKPYFRAGMHLGKVIVGEIGDFKREIAFLGDTVNTTARIQEMCKTKQQDLLISESLYKRIKHPDYYQAHNFGMIHLRGRKEEIRIFSIQPVNKQTLPDLVRGKGTLLKDA